MNGYPARVFQLGSRYPRQIARLRVGIGVCLLILAAFLYGSDEAGRWGWLLIVLAALHFGLAYRLVRIARRGTAPRFQ